MNHQLLAVPLRLMILKLIRRIVTVIKFNTFNYTRRFDVPGGSGFEHEVMNPGVTTDAEIDINTKEGFELAKSIIGKVQQLTIESSLRKRLEQGKAAKKPVVTNAGQPKKEG